MLFFFIFFALTARATTGVGGWTVIVRGGVDGGGGGVDCYCPWGVDGVEGGGLLLSVGVGWKWTVTVGGVLWVDCQGGGGVGL